MEILGIDPGLRCCGLALYNSGIISTKSIRSSMGNSLSNRVSYITSESVAFAKSVDLLILEHMRVYPMQKGDPNDLIDISILVGSLMATIQHKECILASARQWKGQTPKNVSHKRIESRLGYDISDISSDARDAIGLMFYGKDIQNARQS